MQFSSDYPCFIKFKQGGQFDGQGLCAMEVASIMAFRDDARIGSYGDVFDPTLASLIITVNDLLCPDIDDEERADILWPILPSLFGTAGLLPFGFPAEGFYSSLGVSPSTRYPPAAIHEYSKVHHEDGTFHHSFTAGVGALKAAITMVWTQAAQNGSPKVPQGDFTEEQITNLISWMATQTDIDPTSYLRNGTESVVR